MKPDILATLVRPSFLLGSTFESFTGARLHGSIYSYDSTIAGYVKQSSHRHGTGKPDAKNNHRNHKGIARSCAVCSIGNRTHTDQNHNQTKYRIKNADHCSKGSGLVGLENVAAVDAVHRGAGNIPSAICAYKKGQIGLRGLSRRLSFIGFARSRNTGDRVVAVHGKIGVAA